MTVEEAAPVPVAADPPGVGEVPEANRGSQGMVVGGVSVSARVKCSDFAEWGCSDHP